MSGELTEKQREVLKVLDDCCLVAFEAGLELRTSPQAAAARMRALEKRGLVRSFIPGAGDNERYWELTDDGKETFAESSK